MQKSKNDNQSKQTDSKKKEDASALENKKNQSHNAKKVSLGPNTKR